MAVLTKAALPAVEKVPWPPLQGEWTYEDCQRLSTDGWQYEIIHGRLIIVPAPRPIHQLIIGELLTALTLFLRQHPLGKIFSAPIDALVPDKAEPVQPDLVFVAAERMDIVTQRAIEGTPDLTIEVLSLSNWLDDRRTKFALYAEMGVREYWIVDPEAETVEVYRWQEGAFALHGRFVPGDVASSALLEGFSVEVDAVLRADE